MWSVKRSRGSGPDGVELGIGQQTIDGRNNPRYGRDSAETQVLALEDVIGEQVSEALRVPSPHRKSQADKAGAEEEQRTGLGNDPAPPPTGTNGRKTGVPQPRTKASQAQSGTVGPLYRTDCVEIQIRPKGLKRGISSQRHLSCS